MRQSFRKLYHHDQPISSVTCPRPPLYIGQQNGASCRVDQRFNTGGYASELYHIKLLTGSPGSLGAKSWCSEVALVKTYATGLAVVNEFEGVTLQAWPFDRGLGRKDLRTSSDDPSAAGKNRPSHTSLQFHYFLRLCTAWSSMCGTSLGVHRFRVKPSPFPKERA
ncbi:uncharacterized protein PGTG_07759 [Puccinia graminis f. sp. tritici CRL 75-36-700-3]|uniref:Uncharacterized protein n=1 Tax=Puccinia graminis f. sp. tritici (strain CRL 75-36-700-3 / race SCCL) TaxID=418459 RepID=E3KBM5_PUCGT|nr:uncharacterized protein PGTG_07759 [Puccinia graminis f. sp. tritici CRL 75-36-700-3]EFP81510.2 hypothetical protein PGTG_07759 [Puccinia graminis f. sp. tritici CRL 75-36-700-3]